MDNQEAIKILGQYDVSNLHFYTTDGEEIPFTEWSDAIEMAISALQAQEAKNSNESSKTQKALDTISRQAAIDTDGLDEEIRCEMCKNPMHTDRGCDGNCKYDEKLYEKIIQILNKRITPLPSAQPTLYGYNVEHLILIASVLQKENLPPERITEALTDIGRVVAIVRDEVVAMVRDEFADNLRKVVENAGFDKQTSGD